MVKQSKHMWISCNHARNIIVQLLSHATESVMDDEHLNNALNPFLFVDHDGTHGSDPESN